MKKKRRYFKWIVMMAAGLAIIIAVSYLVVFVNHVMVRKTPEELLAEYMDNIPKQKYDVMYSMIDVKASGNISKEDFIRRNSAIYEGIEVQNMVIEILSYDKKEEVVTYQTSFETIAGQIRFENEATFKKNEGAYALIWDDSLIFPELSSSDQVRVDIIQAERGAILDRNGKVLAGKGTASSVGIVPGKLQDKNDVIQKLAELLEMEPDEIEAKLSEQWVKEDSFVPVKTISRNIAQEAFLEIPGVMITEVEVREYPLKEAATHLIGYVQNVTAEDLEEHEGEGYTVNSIIGKSGLEGLFEKELKGQDGCRILIVDDEGSEKEELACTLVQNGQAIHLTIDAGLQSSLYEQFQEDKGCSVAIQPDTGEVLALVSTPSYDNNEFILGLSDERWAALNEDENQPLYNRFRQVWCPGSTLKPVVAAIGLESCTVDPAEDYGSEGLSWQKDASWGSYYVTTLHEYAPVNLENALIYSDNIYFAKAALKIGAEEMENSLKRLGFCEELPFEIQMGESQYSNTESIETEVQLADSGYGQGQILVNPLHLACIYSSFCNDGNVIRPYLIYQNEAKGDAWIPDVFSKETATVVLDGMKKVVNDPNGTGYAAHREDIILAGKTGTAELKESQEDTTGTELGWFAVFTAEETAENPILIVSMVEDVKERGGSGYVVEKDRQVLEEWFER